MTSPTTPAGHQILTDAVLSADPYQALVELLEGGWLAGALPELVALADTARSANGRQMHKDNLDHSLRVCAQTPPRLTVRLAGLLHDVGKASTRRADGGQISFHQHEAVGSRLATKALARLGYDELTVSSVAQLVILSGRTYGFAREWTDSAVRRVMADAGPLLEDLLDLSRADCTSKRPGRRAQIVAKVDEFAAAAAAIAAKDAEGLLRPTLNGVEIAELLNVSGPQLGQAWRWLRDEVKAGRCLERDQAADALKSWMGARRGNVA